MWSTKFLPNCSSSSDSRERERGSHWLYRTGTVRQKEPGKEHPQSRWGCSGLQFVGAQTWYAHYKFFHKLCVGQLSFTMTNAWGNQLIKRKGSLWLIILEVSMINWPSCFWASGEAADHSKSTLWGKLPTSWKLGSKEKEEEPSVPTSPSTTCPQWPKASH